MATRRWLYGLSSYIHCSVTRHCAPLHSDVLSFSDVAMVAAWLPCVNWSIDVGWFPQASPSPGIPAQCVFTPSDRRRRRHPLCLLLKNKLFALLLFVTEEQTVCVLLVHACIFKFGQQQSSLRLYLNLRWQRFMLFRSYHPANSWYFQWGQNENNYNLLHYFRGEMIVTYCYT